MYCDGEERVRFRDEKHSVVYSGRERLTLVIWGGGHLGQNILDHGLLLNLFAPDQEIAYHMVGDTV